MEELQNQTSPQCKASEPNDTVSRPIGETSQSSVNSLDKEFNSKMQLRKIDYDMKQKELEMELHRLERELTVWYTKSLCRAQYKKPIAFQLKNSKESRTFSADLTNLITLQTLKIVVLIIQGTHTTIIESVSIKKAYLNEDP